MRVVAISDLHCGHVVGLTPVGYWSPTAHKEARAIQREMWKWYEQVLDELSPVDALLVLGDCIDGRGDRSGATEQLTTDWKEQADMAVACIERVKARSVVMVHGCLTAGHKILMSDLTYRNIEDLRAGDDLFAFDEKTGGRRLRSWKKSKVISNDTTTAEVCDIYLSDDTKITATYDHPFLTPHRGRNASQWFTVRQMMEWDTPFYFPRAVPVWEEDRSYEAGYVSAFFDGEGTLSQRIKKYPDDTQKNHFTIQGYQKNNPCLDYLLQCLNAGGFDFKVYEYEKGKSCNAIRINGGFQESIRFLGKYQPKRLLSVLDYECLPGVKRLKKYTPKTYVTHIEPAGKQKIYQLSTSTKTYVSDGFLSHNTPYHVGRDGEDYERYIADDVGADIGGHEWAEAHGVIFDLKHKIGSSQIPHGRHTAIARERLWNLLWHERNGAPKAHIILRGHVHYFNYCGGADWLAMTLPALQGPGSKYGVRQCSGTVHFGLVHFDINEDGTYEWQAHLLPVKAARPKPVKL